MSSQEPTRGEIVAALSNPASMSSAALQTGTTLRETVAKRLRSADLEVVVIAADGVGSTRPYPGAQVVWQQCSGGEFGRHLVSWRAGETTFSTREPGGAVHIQADCAQCGQRTELTVDIDVPSEALRAAAVDRRWSHLVTQTPRFRYPRPQERGWSAIDTIYSDQLLELR